MAGREPFIASATPFSPVLGGHRAVACCRRGRYGVVVGIPVERAYPFEPLKKFNIIDAGPDMAPTTIPANACHRPSNIAGSDAIIGLAISLSIAAFASSLPDIVHIRACPADRRVLP